MYLSNFLLRKARNKRVFFRKAVLKDFAKYSGKHMYHSPFSKKIASRTLGNLFKKGL